MRSCRRAGASRFSVKKKQCAPGHGADGEQARRDQGDADPFRHSGRSVESRPRRSARQQHHRKEGAGHLRFIVGRRLQCGRPARCASRTGRVLLLPGYPSGLSTADLLLASARFMKAKGWTKVGVITSTDATGQDADRVIAEAFRTVGGINVIDVSVSAQMAHIKASGAQVLIAWSTGSPFGTLLRGALEAGLNLPILTSSGNLTYPQMKAYASFMPKELYFPASPGFAPNQLPNGPLKRAVQTYQAAFKAAGIEPDEGYALAWDPALMVVDALKKYGTGMNAAQLKSYLDGLTDWTGIWGTHNFKAVPQRGVDVNSVILVRWDAAKNSWVGVSKPGGQPL